MTQTHFKKVKNPDYLGSCDLQPKIDLIVTIHHIEIRNTVDQNGKKGDVNVAVFTDAKIKPMILNMTNCKTIKSFISDPELKPYIENWKNIPIAIYIDYNIRVGKDVTDGLRIRPIQPKLKLPPATEEEISKAIDNIKTAAKEKLPVIDWFKKNRILTELQLKKLEDL